MKSIHFEILLENLNIDHCKYHLISEDGGVYCERAWENEERLVLKQTKCQGNLIECERSNQDVLRKENNDEKPYI